MRMGVIWNILFGCFLCHKSSKQKQKTQHDRRIEQPCPPNFPGWKMFIFNSILNFGDLFWDHCEGMRVLPMGHRPLFLNISKPSQRIHIHMSGCPSHRKGSKPHREFSKRPFPPGARDGEFEQLLEKAWVVWGLWYCYENPLLAEWVLSPKMYS